MSRAPKPHRGWAPPRWRVPGLGKYEVPLRGKNIAILSSGAALLISGWMPIGAGTLTALTVAGGAAMVGGCSGKSDTRTDARTEARTAERAEQRVEDRHD